MEGKVALVVLIVALLVWLERDYRHWADRVAQYEELRRDGLNDGLDSLDAERAAEI